MMLLKLLVNDLFVQTTKEISLLFIEFISNSSKDGTPSDVILVERFFNSFNQDSYLINQPTQNVRGFVTWTRWMEW